MRTYFVKTSKHLDDKKDICGGQELSVASCFPFRRREKMHLSLAGSRRTDPLRAKQIQKDVHWRARSYWRFRSFKNRTIPEEGLMTKTCFSIKLRVNEDRMGLFWIEWLQIKEWRWRLRWTFTEAGGLIWTWFEGSCTMKNRAGDPKINASSSGEQECATDLI